MHDFDAPVAAVEAALLDPQFWSQLRLPGVAPPTIVATSDSAVTVGMAWAGRLEGLGRRIAGSDHIAWRHLERAGHQGFVFGGDQVQIVRPRADIEPNAVDRHP